MTSQVELGWASGDRPGQLVFAHLLPEAEAVVIAGCVSTHVGACVLPRIGALEPTDTLVGRFCATDDRGRSWFVRVTRRWGDPELERLLVDHLDQAGVPVDGFVACGISLRWKSEQLRVDIRRFIGGTHFAGSDSQIVALGRTLAACHRTLANCTHADRVRQAALRRADRFDRVRSALSDMLARDDFDALIEAAAWARAHRQWLSDLVAHFDPWQARRAGAQCLHGEVHPANVLFAAGGSILIDFEEATHVFAPPAWDLAYAVQRFCVADESDTLVVARRMRCMAEGYGAPLPALEEMMLQVAWTMAVAAIDVRLRERLLVPASEFEKFVRLTDAIVRHGVVLGT